MRLFQIGLLSATVIAYADVFYILAIRDVNIVDVRTEVYTHPLLTSRGDVIQPIGNVICASIIDQNFINTTESVMFRETSPMLSDETKLSTSSGARTLTFWHHRL